MAVTAPPVAGIDRWRGGWIAAELRDFSAPNPQIVWQVASHITELTVALDHCQSVAIDMPLALAQTGRRSAESELRAALGSSARSVFTSPTRAAVVATSQSEATQINRAHDGPGISAQAFGLFASICELREHLTGPDFAHWFESHPETSFAIMNDSVPASSKRTARGVAERLTLLRAHFPTLDAALLDVPPKVPIDDALDALAAAWSATRVIAGQAIRFGPDERDDQGFDLGILI